MKKLIKLINRFKKSNKKIKEQKHFYGTDIWGLAHEIVKPFLQKGMTFYYEIVGYLPSGAGIQGKFDYGQEPGKFGVYIYRITSTNVDGKVIEFSAKQVQDFCKKNALNPVPELYYGEAYNLINSKPIMETKDLEDAKFIYSEVDPKSFGEAFLITVKDKYNEKNCYMCVNKVPEEGCVIRIEGMEIEAYKQKSNAFYMLETSELDKGNSNIEDEN